MAPKRLVHGLDVLSERRAHVRQLRRGIPGRGGALQRRVQRGGDALDHLALARTGRVQFQAELAKTRVLQPLVHDIEGGHLLGDEQHGLAGVQRLRDEVGDRLRLARSGWSFDHEVVAPLGGGEGALLAAIGIHHMGAPLRRIFVVQPRGPHVVWQAEAAARVTDPRRVMS